MKTIPNGAEKVIAARRKGMKPSEMLIVSMIGPVHEQNHTIFARNGCEYDWRWTVGLKLCLYTDQTSIPRPLIVEISRHFPEWLGVYRADLFKGSTASYHPNVADIAKPKSQWRWNLSFMPWTNWQNNEFAFGE